MVMKVLVRVGGDEVASGQSWSTQAMGDNFYMSFDDIVPLETLPGEPIHLEAVRAGRPLSAVCSPRRS